MKPGPFKASLVVGLAFSNMTFAAKTQPVTKPISQVCQGLAKAFNVTLDSETILNCDSRPWTFNGKSALAVALEANHQIYYGVVDQLSSPKLLSQQSETTTHYLGDDRHLLKIDSVLFDLGKLGKGFGIRFNRADLNPSGSSEKCEDLTIVVEKGKTLKPVFQSNMNFHGSYITGYPHTSIDETKSTSVLLITTQGNPPNLLRKSKPSGESQLFVWNDKEQTYAKPQKAKAEPTEWEFCPF